ncbi:MAG: YgjP-like metallopeptidase domain-containing protein [Sterolibacterium sp.]
MKQRSPQLSLRFDAALPDPEARWRDGASIAYLGGQLILRLDTDRRLAVREGVTLHLPLPPAASSRQIRDGAEAWLRQAAAQRIGASIEQHARDMQRPVPHWALSFSARGSWSQSHADGSLRFNWHLIEQSPALIDETVGRALAALPQASATLVMADLWAMQAA